MDTDTRQLVLHTKVPAALPCMQFRNLCLACGNTGLPVRAGPQNELRQFYLLPKRPQRQHGVIIRMEPKKLLHAWELPVKSVQAAEPLQIQYIVVSNRSPDFRILPGVEKRPEKACFLAFISLDPVFLQDALIPSVEQFIILDF